ncbi:MAG: universal stress protein [Acidobacteria bacterium]|nr:universal stress protein [Acidobacteriota bacterium]MBI3421470.1 universal stress protein [Acidobacteriota bacterium]
MVDVKRILCPLNHLPTAADAVEALRYAVALAAAYEAELFVCHCTSDPLTAEHAAHLRQTFEALLHELNGPRPIACQVLLIEGDPVSEIPAAAAERRVDLIVMRSRRRPLAAALLGSTAEAICRTAPCPVFVTHSNEHEWEGLQEGDLKLRRLLIAHDFSNDSELALSYGLLLAQEYQAEVHLMHVLPYEPVPALAVMPNSEAAAFHQAARRLQSAVPAEAFLWCQIKQVVRSGQPYREILTYAEDHEMDLICLGAQGAGFSMHALFGSNADRVLRQASCPVLITRPLKPALKQQTEAAVLHVSPQRGSLMMADGGTDSGRMPEL